MKPINLVTLILIIIGGLNWGLMGLFQLDVVATIFGEPILARIVYILIGAAALWQLYPFVRATQVDEVYAEGAAHR